mmetsp:Transcript_10852/g.17782  ORF Transcript_10852/g.17782 Transcript_10852/m.17782 type:complete len:105 (-) Transcript_10852:900-1214(-)
MQNLTSAEVVHQSTLGPPPLTCKACLLSTVGWIHSSRRNQAAHQHDMISIPSIVDLRLPILPWSFSVVVGPPTFLSPSVSFLLTRLLSVSLGCVSMTIRKKVGR